MNQELKDKFSKLGISLAYHRQIGTLHRIGYFCPKEGFMKELQLEAGSIREVVLMVDRLLK